MLSAPKGAHKILAPLPSPLGEADIYYRNDDNKDIYGREIMTAVQDEPNNRSEQLPKPLLTGDRYLDNALEKLRRSLEARAKKEAAERSAAGTITKPDDSEGETG